MQTEASDRDTLPQKAEQTIDRVLNALKDIRSNTEKKKHRKVYPPPKEKKVVYQSVKKIKERNQNKAVFSGE